MADRESGAATRASAAFPPADVAETETLVRRIHWRNTDLDGSLTSAAFHDNRAEVSTHREEYHPLAELREEFPRYGFAFFPSGRPARWVR